MISPDFPQPTHRLKPKYVSSYTECHGELEHLKIKTKLIDERFVSVMGECVRTRPIHECRCDEGVVYHESIKRELKIRPIYECRFDERHLTC